MGRRTPLGLVILLCAACGVDRRPASDHHSHPVKTETETIMTAHTTDPRIPQIDRGLPDTIATATFALG
ncbi:MAG: hypothetical protein CMJ83_16315 [Planctomycetes bacterium]|jgi:hypothetical protein|nr:hypothetical protein [Planctomycetota bacterium]